LALEDRLWGLTKNRIDKASITKITKVGKLLKISQNVIYLPPIE